MDFEDGDYLEQRNSFSDDGFSTDDDNSYPAKQHISYDANPNIQQLKSMFRYNHDLHQQQQQQHQPKQKHYKQQQEPTMSSSCSPKPIPDYRQQRQHQPRPLTPPKPMTPSPPPTEQQLVQKLTVDLCQTYERCDSSFQYDPQLNPRRILTKPGSPHKNNGFDNHNSDYILYVNGTLGAKYKVLELLGCGTFGQVAKCQHTLTGEFVAIKVIKNKPAYLKQSTIEVEILKHLNNDWDPQDKHHILRLLEHFMYKHHLCLVFELLSVNLYDLIKQNSFKGLSTSLIRSFATQLLDALLILKEAKIIHCDIKPENILLETMESPVIKLIDFGSACQETNQMYSYIQSRFYRSPEVLLGMDYSAAIDMWSFGCIVVELYLGLPLFPGTSEYNQLSRIIDTFGLPPNHMIEQGKHADRYFNNTTNEDGQVVYTWKSRKQYSSEQNKQEKQSKQYFSTTQLDSLILDPPKSNKPKSDADIDQEMSIRMLLLDFLKCILCYEPDKRLTPQQALQHPFISQYLQETATSSTTPPIAASLISGSPSPPSSRRNSAITQPRGDGKCSVSDQISNCCPRL
ncbi:kinase-like domain-containing protein [Absidia repens]|uniref:Kinase-like domain-containing protein n=1 Tax=Absidia repens TaxID=90262 RepID=A0A1X2IWB3_9FUNG|nr:kinase-like domain-containing protein [Absidia repens]